MRDHEITDLANGIEDREELEALLDALKKRKSELSPSPYINSLERHVKSAAQTVKKIIDDGTYEQCKESIEDILANLSSDRYYEYAKSVEPMTPRGLGARKTD